MKFSARLKTTIFVNIKCIYLPPRNLFINFTLKYLKPTNMSKENNPYNEKLNNPSAFPEHSVKRISSVETQTHYQQGMSLRDYFAAKALSAIVGGIYSNESVLVATNTLCKQSGIKFTDEMADRAYLLADAMLKRRA